MARQDFVRTDAGYVVGLDIEEKELIARLVAELRALLLTDDPRTEPIKRRLFPPAYHLADDREADVEYQRLMREELVASRLSALQFVDEALASETPLSEDGMLGFMQSLNAVRLVLGTLLDIGEEDDADDFDDNDPMAGEFALYQYLSHLLDAAVQAVSGHR